MKKAEQNLSLFWWTVDQQYKNKMAGSLHQSVCHLFSEEHKSERTPEWVGKRAKGEGVEGFGV
jgi:hypothetical protein